MRGKRLIGKEEGFEERRRGKTEEEREEKERKERRGKIGKSKGMKKNEERGIREVRKEGRIRRVNGDGDGSKKEGMI